MPGGAELISRLLGATSPEQTNPAFGLHMTTPDMLLSHLNDTLQSDPDFKGSAYENVDEANQDGYNIPKHPIYHDQQGNLVTDPSIISKAQSGSYGVDKPMKTPGFWQRFANPSAADAETRINTQYTTNPEFAQQAEDTRRNIVMQRLGRMSNSLKPSGLLDNQMPEAGYTGLQTPGELLGMNRAAGDLQSNITSPQVQTDITTAKSMLQGAQRQSERQPVEESTLDANAVNALHTATGVGPVRIELAYQQLKNELGREPKQEEIRELLLQGEKNRALVGNALSGTQVSNIPTLQNTEQASIRNAAFEATHPPTPGSPFYRSGTGQPTLNPSYIGTIPQINAKLGQGGVNGGTIPVGNGLHIIGSPSTDMPSRPLRVSPVSLSAPETNTSTTPQTGLSYNPGRDIQNLIGKFIKSQQSSTPEYAKDTDGNPVKSENGSFVIQGTENKYEQNKDGTFKLNDKGQAVLKSRK